MLTRDDVATLNQVLSGPMSAAEVEFLRDIQGLIDFAISNGLSFAMVMSILGHDVNGIARHGMDLSEASACGFVAKVTGYAGYTADAVGESEEEDR